jgi:hypothetical protein
VNCVPLVLDFDAVDDSVAAVSARAWLRKQCLRWLRERHRLNADEMWLLVDQVAQRNSVSKRLGELVDDGLAVVVERRRNSRNRPVNVYALTDAGQRVAALLAGGNQ